MPALHRPRRRRQSRRLDSTAAATPASTTTAALAAPAAGPSRGSGRCTRRGGRTDIRHLLQEARLQRQHVEVVGAGEIDVFAVGEEVRV